MTESPLTVWRKKAGLTQADIAKLADVSQAHVSEIECGVTELCDPIAGFLQRIADRGDSEMSREAGEVPEKQAEFFREKQEERLQRVGAA
ncbi:hypothetical protein LCGC14_0565520 [marine sediment metagenome]|uniref:HTH cro/C1-type domain-containing protein n=1 Tax=marine sediment metagenome TaxID=412755 RepID=A0A0F9RKI3_9ZZZZ